MSYYKFRNRSLDPAQKRMKSWKKTSYLASRNKLRLLDSFNFESQTWGALHKAWVGYIIAKNKYEPDKIVHYAKIIRKLQSELGLKISSFPELDLLALDFYEQNADSLPEQMDVEELLELMLKRDAEELESLKQE